MKTTLLSILALGLAGGTISAAEQGGGVGLKQIADGFVSPTALAPLPGSEGKLLVADQVGTITVLGKDGQREEKLFLDLKSKLTKLNQGFDERGLLGLALHPDFKNNSKFYVYYSAPKAENAPADFDHTSHLSEFTAKGDVLATEKVLLKIDEPYFNHNGGSLQFGPDGFLYIATGDGGDANDVGRRPEIGNGQSLDTLLGKILRIDVNSEKGYKVPSDNPFVGKQGVKPEIFAYGFRNPWRMSFDRGGKHELFAADVGQDAYEEVNVVIKGGNYGWRIKEGFHCFNPKDPKNAPATCAETGAHGEPLLDPIFEYKNFRAFPKDPEAKGISITGGYIYRGKALANLQGNYIFADWSKQWVKGDGVIYSASRSEQGKTWKIQPVELGSHPKGLGGYVVSFGEDADGELYVLTNGANGLIGKNGKVHKLVPM
ncbi:MAG: PQQ-dependent sugar dehydrogenase [Verrucomicrobiales bacterium]